MEKGDLMLKENLNIFFCLLSIYLSMKLSSNDIFFFFILIISYHTKDKKKELSKITLTNY